jgi:hypothetical protein
MEPLGDMSQVESRFSTFGDSVSVGAGLVHSLHETCHTLRTHFGHNRWYS